jgi:hypothetical protein
MAQIGWPYGLPFGVSARIGIRERFVMSSSTKNKGGYEVFDIVCPDCGGMLKVDASTRTVIAHTPAPRKRTFEDLEAAARGMRERMSAKRASSARRSTRRRTRRT